MFTLQIISAIVQFALAIAALMSDLVRRPWNYVLAVFLSMQLLISVASIYLDIQEAKATATSGVIFPGRSFPNISHVYRRDSLPTIRYGKSEFYLSLDAATWWGNEPAGDVSIPRAILEPINAREDEKIYLWMEDGEPRLRMNLYNPRNQLVARIDGSRWIVKREYLWDVNYDDESFEIRNERGLVQFQAVFYDDLIELSFFNHSPEGAYGIGGLVGGHMASWPNEAEPLFTIQPLFKYPSVEFQGVRIDED